jgi:putative transposase
MTQKKDNAKELDWREVFGSGPDGLRELVQQIVQEVLEADMDEAVGAQKSERTAERVGYRSGYYTRTLVTRVGKLVYGYPRIGKGDFGRKCLSGTSGVRKRWSPRWPRCTSRGCRRAR